MERIDGAIKSDSAAKKVSASLCAFLLVLVTLFATLFLITYLHDVLLKRRVEHYGKIIKAYELYIAGDREFESYVKENNLKEVNWLLPKFNLFAVRKSLDEAKLAFEKGNFADTISALAGVRDINSPWNDEIFYLLGCAHAKIGQTDQAKFYLSYFLNGMEGSIYRKSALSLLRDLSQGEERKRIEDVLKKLE